MTTTTLVPLTSHEVCQLLGLTYRQVDYVARTVQHDSPGSGNHRRWDDETVDRLTVAKALLDAVECCVPNGGRSPWPYLVRAVLDGPTPMPGWVTISPDGELTYHGWTAPHVRIGIAARWRPVRGRPS